VKTTFNDKIDSLIKIHEGDGLSWQTNPKAPHDYTGSMTGGDTDAENADPDADEEEKDKKPQKQKDIESLRALKADPDIEHAVKNYGTVRKYQKMLDRKINKLRGKDRREEDAESWVDPAHKGDCTPMSKASCTPRRKAFARRAKAGDFKKK